MILIGDAIASLVPGAQFKCVGDYPSYTVEWINPPVAPVTDDQINQEYLILNT